MHADKTACRCSWIYLQKNHQILLLRNTLWKNSKFGKVLQRWLDYTDISWVKALKHGTIELLCKPDKQGHFTVKCTVHNKSGNLVAIQVSSRKHKTLYNPYHKLQALVTNYNITTSYNKLSFNWPILCACHGYGWVPKKLQVDLLLFFQFFCGVHLLQCYDAVGWVAGRASGL